VLALAAACVAALCATAVAGGLSPNPANHRTLVDKPIEDPRYDDANGCKRGTPKGMKALIHWLERNVRGQSWGTYRCERLKRDGFSVHSESRAVDWHLDAGVAKERRAAMRLIRTLLARDRAHNVHALARRMGVQGLIFDCRAWWSGMESLGRYSYCYRRNGDLRDDLDRTQAHRDHVHIELNWPGARKQTSFWRSPVSRKRMAP
jgi:hypothetical protein